MAESETPIMCTLPPNDLVRRLAEFEALFAEDLTRVERRPLLLRLTFAAADTGREAVIRDLFAAEERCCAFLSFAHERTAAGLVVEVTAPPEAGSTLDELHALATGRVR
ncbi:hypothetical protein [Thermomonospora umbrina]|uniref:Arsenate reductase n=1 Tax=Thermomonospora umbrina TaxID=111806 RepID=A0A3D9SV95_9ACTN|nr:hypothetical protein [Thermomonospora umbrina]REE99889.1 hypothetical protein DFJ69_5406 [Thermomonospora umbrina]